MTLEEPDKGYAWVVLFSSCLINSILSGMARMIGLLYVAVIDHYGVTRQEASIPFTVRNAVRYMGGPLTGVLGQMYGIRAVTFAGGLVAAAGSILCAFAPNVEWIIFYWGVIHGIGFALANTLFQVVINQYFEKHRATASGIVLSGACLSAMIFPFMIDGLISEYGLFGCFLLLGGLFLHVLPPALLLKSPPWVENPEAYARKRAQLTTQQTHEKYGKSDLHISVSEKFNGYNLQSENKCFDQHGVVCTIYRSMENADSTVLQTKTPCPQVGIDNPAYVPENNENCLKLPEKSQTTAPSQPPPKKNKNNIFSNIREIPKLYLNPIYVLISLSMAAYFNAFLPVVGVIVDYSRDKGIPIAYEKFLIYSLSIGDFLGRLCFGWVTDRKFISFSNFMVGTYLSKAIFLFLLTLSNSVVVNTAVLGLYGVTSGIALCYFPVLVHKYVDQDKQTIAIGCIGLLSSVATFGLPPLIGHFRDHVGCYDHMFYIIAMTSAATGLLWLFVPIYERMKNKSNVTNVKE